MLDVLHDVQPHYLYHFAAQAINSISYQNPHLTTEVNVQGTMNLLESLRRNNLTKCRLIFAGSSTEYGRTTGRFE
jgi:GDP-D-mannose dehydratase